MQVVIATAGHVDHGKSTLVRALTGMEPDRWAEERRRGMTIDLGFAWTDLPGGHTAAFVDVPGHERFIGNMLAGLGPAAAVMVVVAADEGWRQQSAEHLAAAAALEVRHGLLVITRSDLADPLAATEQARQQFSGTSLADIPSYAVSGRTGEGIDRLRTALAALARGMPMPDPAARVRLWIDRGFTIRGAGTVVTGTLGEGRLTVGDRLDLGGRPVRVRGLQSLGRPLQTVIGPARVAANLRDVHPEQVRRGDVLIRPEQWRPTRVLDLTVTGDPSTMPRELTLHIGSGAFPARLRPLGSGAARITVSTALPLRPGERVILRDPGGTLLIGARVVDVAPPELRRRGAGAARAQVLTQGPDSADPVASVLRRGAIRVADLDVLTAGSGADADRSLTADPRIRLVAGWWVSTERWASWLERLATAVDGYAAGHPLDPGLSPDSAARIVTLPDPDLVAPLAQAAGMEVTRGRIHRPAVRPTLGEAERGLRLLEKSLRDNPFAAPEQEQLAALGLEPGHLAAAQVLQRVIRLPGQVILLPDAPARAMRVLAALPGPFTLSEARQALATSRRVAVPLLEHLDERGWTARVDGQRRIVRLASGSGSG